MTSMAFVFPGQGSQSVGMLDAWGDHPAVKAVLAESSDALGQDLAALISSGTKDELGLTTNTQPVMLVAGIAAYRAWLAEGGAQPAMVAGHSLGEYTACVAAGVLSLADAVKLVRFRATAMQEAVPVGVGAMAAVLGLAADQVVAACQTAQTELGAAGGEVVEAVNFNDPLQTVIAGSKAAVDLACSHAKQLGAKRALLLPVSAPFHSSLMKPAADRLLAQLQSTTLHAPSIPLVNNIDVAIETDPYRIRDALYRQAFGPVRWVDSVRHMATQGMCCVVECGPGKVLTGLVKRIDAQINAISLSDPASLQQLKELCP